MNKLGPHFQRFPKELENLIAQWHPPVVVSVDPNQYIIQRIREISPETFIIGRKSEEGDWDSPNLKERACYWADRCAELGPCDAYYCWNEPLWHGDLVRFGRFDDFQCWFRERILTKGVEAIAFNFATGNFTKDGPELGISFPKTVASFKHFGIHEYDWIVDPNLRPVDTARLGYYWNRWPYWLQDIGRDDITLWITECGMTQSVHEKRPDEGWLSGADGMTDDDYLAWARWYNSQLVQDKRIGGAALFNFAGWGWETFEHLGWQRLNEIVTLQAEPPPEEPPSGGQKMLIYDFSHGPYDIQTRDAAWLASVFGPKLKVHPVREKFPNIKQGDLYWAVDYLDARVGDTSCIINTRDANRLVVPSQMTVFFWPSAETLADQGLEYSETGWTNRGAVGLTNLGGDAGPSMGIGAYYDPQTQEGPHSVWIYSQYPSEMVSGIGMLPGGSPEPGVEGPHAHVNIGFMLRTYSGSEPPPQPPSDIAQQIIYHANEIEKLAAGIGFTPSSITLESADGRVARFSLVEIK